MARISRGVGYQWGGGGYQWGGVISGGGVHTSSHGYFLFQVSLEKQLQIFFLPTILIYVRKTKKNRKKINSKMGAFAKMQVSQILKVCTVLHVVFSVTCIACCVWRVV